MSHPPTVASAPAPGASVPGLTPPKRRTATPRRIGEVIVELGFADHETVEKAVVEARDSTRTTGQTLLDGNYITPDQLAHAVAERNGIDHVDLEVFSVDPAATAFVDASVLRRYRAVPIAFQGDRTLIVATADPTNVLAMDDLAMMTGYEIRRACATKEDVDALLRRLDSLDHAVEQVDDEVEEETTLEVRESAEDAPVVKLVQSVIAQAIDRGASDIHFDPEPTQMKVRYRIDGVMSEAATVPRQMLAGLVSRVKIMADLDIAEKRLPQDGRVGLTVDGRKVDLRIATLPIVRGEAVVMRILDKSGQALALENLGMAPVDLDRFRRAITQTHGSILATGPTGSGKSTSLYAGLGEIDRRQKTIITIEDPVEYEMEGIKQIHVNTKVGLDFATGLRSMMRSDPDVIMVGEIRDRETAQIAIEAALTGHLVFSTLHTNDAPMSMARLIEMGIEPFLVASGINCVIAQRLARRLCDCKRPVELGADVLRRNHFDATQTVHAFEPVGCNRCGGTGYRGRIGLYELMEVTDEIRELVTEKRPVDEIRDVAISQGMRRLRADGLDKIKQGQTSMLELLRALGGSA